MANIVVTKDTRSGSALALITYLPTPYVRSSLIASQTSVRVFGFYTMAQYRP